MASVPGTIIREHRARERAKARLRMHRMIASLDLEGGRMLTGLGYGDAWQSALDKENELRADLIVAGRQGKSAMADFLLGSVTRRLLTRSKCDMLIIPRPAFVPSELRASVATPRSRSLEPKAAAVAPELAAQTSTSGGKRPLAWW